MRQVDKGYFGQNKDGECFLMSVALLAGINPDGIRRWAERVSGVDFSFLSRKALSNPMPFLSAFHMVCYEMCRRYVPDLTMNFDDVSSSGTSLMESYRFPRLPKKGKGMLLVTYWDSGHAMVYKDGEIHDCNLSGPMAVAVWRRSQYREVVRVRFFPVKVCRRKNETHSPWLKQMLVRAKEVSDMMRREGRLL